MASYGRPAEIQAEVDRHSWLDLAGILLLLVGFFNIIDGLTAISGSDYLSSELLFANLDAWGWFFLIVGLVQIVAGLAVMKGAGWAAIVGIVTAFVNAVSQLSASHTFTFWALTIGVIDVLVIYGLVKYGGDRGGRPAT
ncbi:MAG: hypothetical protein ACJ74B_04480 [Gaiellaceae bacterium]